MIREMTLILGSIGAAAVIAGAGRAADDTTVAPAFGNTIVSTYPDGRTAELWLSADGGYTGEGRRHDRSSGHWKVKDAKLCLKQSRPIPVPFSFCTPLPANYEIAWSGKAPTGEAISIRLVRGHAGGGAPADQAHGAD